MAGHLTTRGGHLLKTDSGHLANSCLDIIILLTGDLSFYFLQGATSVGTELANVKNDSPVGGGTLLWERVLTVDAAISAMTALPASNLDPGLAPQADEDITVSIDPTGIANGDHTGTLLVRHEPTPSINASLPILVRIAPKWTSSVKVTKVDLIWGSQDFLIYYHSSGGQDPNYYHAPPAAPDGTKLWYNVAQEKWWMMNTQPAWKSSPYGPGYDYYGNEVLKSISLRASDGYPSGTASGYYVLNGSSYPIQLITWVFGPDVW